MQCNIFWYDIDGLVQDYSISILPHWSYCAVLHYDMDMYLVSAS